MAKRTKRTVRSKGVRARKKATRKTAAKRTTPKRKVAKKIAKKVSKKRGGAKTTRTRARKEKQFLRPEAATAETTIVDIVEEPVPGVITVTEFESTRIDVPESDEEDGD